ncbi:MAG: iron-containing redox enzyme family protein [Pseudomonadota bacterium]
MSAFEDLRTFTTRLFARSAIERHALFVRLEAGELSPAQLRALALQIHHVVDHFPRFLAAILANIPDYRVRMPLVENLFEEHGRMNPHAVHVETYAKFLASLGLSAREIGTSRPAVPVVAYNRAITDLCLHYPYPEGLGALGVIEEIVARVSLIVGRFAARNLKPSDGSLAHFGDHETLDVSHSSEIYELAAACYQGETRRAVEQGLLLGMYYHRRLYTDLLEEIVA